MKDHHLALTELVYIAEAVHGEDARSGEGNIIFTLPKECTAEASCEQIELPKDKGHEALKAWAKNHTKDGRLSELIAEALEESAKLEGTRFEISQRLIAVLEGHIRDGLGQPVDFDRVHEEVFGFPLAKVDHKPALERARNFLSTVTTVNKGEALYHTAIRFQNTLPKLNSPEDTKQLIEQTLTWCIAAAENLIEYMQFSPEQRDAIKRKIQEIRCEISPDAKYPGKANIKNGEICMTFNTNRPQVDKTNLQLIVIHEFSHVLQMIMLELGYEEGRLHFENLISIAGSGIVAIDEGLADLHSHDILQKYNPSQRLFTGAQEAANIHWHATIQRRQVLRVNLAVALSTGASRADLERLVASEEFSPEAAKVYCDQIDRDSASTNRLYIPSYHHGENLFKRRHSINGPRTIREFLHMEGPADYLSLSRQSPIPSL